MRRLLFPHLAVWVIGGALVRIALVPAEVCPPVTTDEVRTAIHEAADWLARGIDERGRFVYGYFRDRDAVNPDYNIVRHAAATNTLFHLAAEGDDSFLEAAEVGLDYLTDRLITHGDWMAVAEGGQPARIGATGLALAALAHRRQAVGDPEHDDLMRALARFLVSQQQADGSILASWDQETGRPVPDTYGSFATGEALWGLALMHRLFPGEGWDVPALRTARYLAEDRARNEGYVARLPEHWGAYALAEFSPEELDDGLAAYARRLAGYFSLRIEVESQRRGEGINLLVRGVPGPPSGVGTSGEGLSALYRLAGHDPRLSDIREDMREDLLCMAGMMVSRQIGADEAAHTARPELTRGAWFYRGYSQIDDQQHLTSALLGTLPATTGGGSP